MDMQDAIAGEEQGTGQLAQGEARLSTGVVIRGKAAPREVLMRAYERIARDAPPVPMWLNPDKGREEPNPDDPDYLAANKQHEARAALAIRRALIMYGVQVVSVPDGLPDVDSEDWREEVEVSEMSSGHSPLVRLYDWLTIKAGPTEDDYKLLFFVAGSANGTLEVDAAAAMKSVRGKPRRRSD